MLPSFVGLSSCRRQELSRLLVDKKASLSDWNSSFVFDFRFILEPLGIQKPILDFDENISDNYGI